MAKKRISRSRKRELEEPDEFITLSQRIIRFATAHKEKIIIGAGIAVALGIAFLGRQYFSQRAETKAFALIDQNMAKYDTAARNGSSEKAYTAVEKDFQKILEKYSETEGGKVARLMFANICFDGGDYDRAIQLYSTSLEEFAEFPFIKNMILNSLGHAHEEKKDYPGAVRYFEMSAQGSGAGVESDALFNLGTLYAEMGLNDKSTDAFKKIISGYTDSIYYEMAKERLAGQI